jgi:hypothetical protein
MFHIAVPLSPGVPAAGSIQTSPGVRNERAIEDSPAAEDASNAANSGTKCMKDSGAQRD